jgi:predicted O-methyltransferase YrrM
MLLRKKEAISMNQEQWTAVDNYFCNLLVPSDAALDAAIESSDKAGLPSHHVAPNQGKLLQLLAQVQGARNILEIGTLAGYSTIWLSRALPANGRLVTLESDPLHAEIAQSNITRAGLSHLVELRLAQAVESLQQLDKEGGEPFDFIFIDADKPSNPVYLDWALKLSRIGTLIIGDNVVRNGEVIDSNSKDAKVQGVRRFSELLAAEPRVSATALQTVGSKGYDGFIIARVIS